MARNTVFVMKRYETSAMFSLTAMDITISVWIQSFKSATVDRVALFFRSLLDDETIMLGLSSFAWLCNDLFGVLFVLHQLGTAELVNGIFKFLSARPRPFWNPHGVRNFGKFECHFSLPSSHAQVTAAVPTALVLWFAPSESWATAFAAAVIVFQGVSRVYLGAHFMSDVVIGWVLGVFAPLALHRGNAVQWFAELPTTSRYVFALHPFLLLGILILVRLVAMARTSAGQIEEWTRNARAATPTSEAHKRVAPFDLLPYIPPACSMGGSALGAAYAIDNANKDSMSALLSCSLTHNTTTVVLRLLHGYVGMVALSVGVFVIPARMERRGSHAAGVLVGMLFSTAMGLWLIPGNFWVAHKVWGLAC